MIEYFDVTVVVPTKNRVAMLARALMSINEQTVIPKQVIVVDDNSDIPLDKTFFDTFQNLQLDYIYNVKSLGGAATRNLGLNKANTNFVSFLDDDDSWSPYYLENVKLVANSIGNKPAGFYSSKKFVLSNSLQRVLKKRDAIGQVALDDLVCGNVIGGTSSVTLNRLALEKVSGFDEHLPALQDYEFWLSLALAGVSFYPCVNSYMIYTINVNNNQISSNFNNHIRASNIIREKLFDRVPKGTSPKLDAALDYSVVKAVHRRSYIKSLPMTFRMLLKHRRVKGVLLLIPYKAMNFFGKYST
ncbi:glycosyltransferase family 2 protein [Paraglaciecola agarilytica]|uniref:Glycosyltransferase 2-like domain-containing protein n=1 Tax=Paraglaciecola chathamensis TaxID=368405 RepID=A0A8H9I8C2_9ALTE|nr:glycosyltransferase family A protein [Paraglaciecola oceanifecundans]AEE22084.1 glycosyl transferase family 2 [Glaciecola sp. 4H-3-7+YE-5]GGZ57461.1 hypothetical protein GCM10011274_14620 [Paraglaciecola oceanifecundans]